FYELETKESFFAGLAQDVVRERIEIDFVDFHGPVFAGWDRATVLAYLVRAGLAEAVFFSSSGNSVPPAEVLHKKPIVLAPGYFGHVDAAHGKIHAELLAAGVRELRKELGESNFSASSGPLGIFSLTAAAVKPDTPAPEIVDLLRRIDALLAERADVLLFR